MRAFASLIFCATLPLAAGFAVSTAHAQGMQYDGPVNGTGTAMSASPVTGVPLGTLNNNAPAAGIPMPGNIAANNTVMQVANPAVMPMGMNAGASGDMTRMAQMEQQVRELTNQLEQRDFQIRQLQQTFDKYVADTNQRIQSLESRGPAPASDNYTAPAQQPSAATPPAPTPLQNDNSAAAVSGGVTDPNGAFRPTSTPQLGQITETVHNNGGAVTSGTPQGGSGQQGAAAAPSAAKAYDDAFSYLQQSNYTDAQRAFSDFLKTYPTHPLAANAKYWLGEAYFAQTQYSMAAKTFAKAFQEHPQGQKAPDALLKLAITLDKMNKKNDACLTLGELTKRFPSGPASVLRRGQEESTRMQCAA